MKSKVKLLSKRPLYLTVIVLLFIGATLIFLWFEDNKKVRCYVNGTVVSITEEECKELNKSYRNIMPTPTIQTKNTPSVVYSPKKNTNEIETCKTRAVNESTNCLQNCQNTASAQSLGCPMQDLSAHQSCLNGYLLLASNCMNDCNSTAKIAINNCVR